MDIMQKLQGFTYATALDLNMGYYTIRLAPDARKILPWGEGFDIWFTLVYNSSPAMGLAASSIAP
eukprot:14448068-Ditylum_brightwellii.AAC.1